MSGRQSPIQTGEASASSGVVVSTPLPSSAARSPSTATLDMVLDRLNDWGDRMETLDDNMAGFRRSLQRIDERMDTVMGRVDAVEQWATGADTESTGAPAATLMGEDPATVAHQAPVTNTAAEKARARSPPPHLTLHGTPGSAPPPRPARAAARSSSPTITPQAFKPPQVHTFRDLDVADKVTFRRIAGLLGGSVRKSFNAVADPDSALHEAERYESPPGSHRSGGSDASSEADTDRSKGHRALLPAALPTPPTSPYGGSVSCKTDNFGPGFDGKPSELEAFLSRIRDVARSDRRDAWQSAVVRALPLVLKGDAAAWHESLPDSESDALTSVSLWIETLRLAFPVNVSALRTEAHDRAWRPALESANAYYYQKLRLLRHAWGFDQAEERLVSDIRAGFPASFRTMLRVPHQGATLHVLRLQIATYEPEWELMYPALKTPAVTSAAASKTASVKTSAAPSWTPPAMARSASAPAPPAAAQPSPRTPTSAFGLAGTYDPSRITPAANGKKRVYRRPDTNEPMELNRPCGRCGQDHFNFEHSYLVTSPAQIRMLEVWPGDDDYPVLYTGDAQDAGSEDFH